VADESEGIEMCPHDSTGSFGATHCDDPCPARPADPTADASPPGDSNPAWAILPASDPLQEASATFRIRDTGTLDHIATNLTDPESRTTPPTDGPHVPAMPTVPGYELLAPLGEGGMGVLWKARHVKLNRMVALKMVLGEHRAGAKELIRFLAEAEAVAAINHPHVVQVYEYGEANGRPFLAMEYLPGGSLTERLKQTG
jgi:serine/threonine protein kinase